MNERFQEIVLRKSFRWISLANDACYRPSPDWLEMLLEGLAGVEPTGGCDGIARDSLTNICFLHTATFEEAIHFLNETEIRGQKFIALPGSEPTLIDLLRIFETGHACLVPLRPINTMRARELVLLASSSSSSSPLPVWQSLGVAHTASGDKIADSGLHNPYDAGGRFDSISQSDWAALFPGSPYSRRLGIISFLMLRCQAPSPNDLVDAMRLFVGSASTQEARQMWKGLFCKLAEPSVKAKDWSTSRKLLHLERGFFELSPFWTAKLAEAEAGIGNFDEAMRLVEEAYASDCGQKDGYARIALFARERKDWEFTRKLLRMDYDANRLTLAWLLKLAEAEAGIGNFDEAMRLVEEAYGSDRGQKDGYARIALFARERKDWEFTRKLLRMDYDANRLTLAWLLKFAEAEAGIGNFDEAMRLVEEAYASDCGQKDGYARIALFARERKDWEFTRKLLRMDHDANRLTLAWLLKLAEAEAGIGNFDEAMRLVEEAYGSDRGQKDGYARIALFARERKDWEFTRKLLRMDHDANRLTLAWLLKLAEAEAGIGNFDEAMRLVEEAYASDCGQKDGYARIALFARERKDWEFTRKLLRMDYDANRLTLAWLLKLAEAEAGIGNFDEAMRLVEEAYGSDRGQKDGYARIALFARERKDWEFTRKLLRMDYDANRLTSAWFARLAEAECRLFLPYAKTSIHLPATEANSSTGIVLWIGFNIGIRQQSNSKHSFFESLLRQNFCGNRSLWPASVDQDGGFCPQCFFQMGDVKANIGTTIFTYLRYPLILVHAWNEIRIFPKQWYSTLRGAPAFQLWTKKVIQSNRIRLAVFWGNWQPAHRLVARMLSQNGVPVRYMEYSMLPGYLCWEKRGLNVDSASQTGYRSFCKAANGTEVLMAHEWIDQTRKYRPSNKKQISTRLPQAWVEGKHRLLVAGVHSVAIRLHPRETRYSRRMVPGFSSNRDFLECILKAVDGTEVMVAYKPHPDTNSDPEFSRIENLVHPNLFLIPGEQDIYELLNQCDLVATLGSGVSHLALIHDRPCILAGRNPLWGTGCCYDVDSKRALKHAWSLALNQGLTEHQKARFVEFVVEEIRNGVVGQTNPETGLSPRRSEAYLGRLLKRFLRD
jgi:hypothetical protein